jgi:hypothetical protein
MILNDYRDEYDCAPLELIEFAEGAWNITDCADLQRAADEYLTAKKAFEDTLDHFDITVG